MSSIPNSGSMVSLVCQNYFDHYIRPKLGPAKGLEVSAHNVFNLRVQMKVVSHCSIILKWNLISRAQNEGCITLSHYFEMDVMFLGFKVPKVGFLVAKEPNTLFDQNRKIKWNGIIGWNLVELVYQEFIKKYTVAVFENFICPSEVDLLMFSQLCFYHYSDMKTVGVNKMYKQGHIYLR